MSKVLPKELTSYDLLKAAAVIIMVIDHIGFYFFPEDMWWRAIGRIGFPVWFFLIGYARSRDLPPKLWGGAVILVLSNLAAGMYLFPLNALFTIIAIRLLLPTLVKLSLYNVQALIAFSVTLMILIIPTNFFTEYGSQALIMAMFGYLVRNREMLKNAKPILNAYMVFALGTFLLMQQTVFVFSEAQWYVMGGGTFLVMGILFFFNSVTYPKLTAAAPRFITFIIQIMGRRTLEIYVFHLLLFKAVVVTIFPEIYTPLDWSLFYMVEGAGKWDVAK